MKQLYFRLRELARGIWHPTYGKCGGAVKDCSTRPPIDLMDQLFAEHDQNLYQTEFLDEPERTLYRAAADIELARGLRELDPKTLSFYGRIYRRMAMMVFR